METSLGGKIDGGKFGRETCVDINILTEDFEIGIWIKDSLKEVI